MIVYKSIKYNLIAIISYFAAIILNEFVDCLMYTVRDK